MSKKQIIQLSILAFCLYLGIFFVMDDGEYYDAYGLVTILFLLGLYVIYSQKDFKFVKYLRISLYIILGIVIYGFISENFGYSSSYSIYVDWMGARPFEALRIILLDFYLVYFLIISAVLLLNKSPKVKTLKIGKLKISL